MHAHPFHELALMFEGTCEWHFRRGDAVVLQDGWMLLLPPGKFHRECIAQGKPARQGWVGFDVEGPVPDEWFQPVAAGGWSIEMRRLFRVVYEEHQSPAFGARRRCELALEEILILFQRLFTGHQPSSETGSHDARRIAGAAAETIRANLTQPLAVRDLAAYHSLSVSRFSAIFRQVHGVGPGRFLRQERIRFARKLLQDRSLSIKEIGAQCGFADAAHFAHAFSLATGKSPRAYRDEQAGS